MKRASDPRHLARIIALQRLFANYFNQQSPVVEELPLNELADLDEIEEWDSLSVVSFLAMANATYGKKVKKEDLKNKKTIADLYSLVK